MEILHQIGELFLESLPTVIVVLLFYAFLRWAFFTPIQKAMAERTARIEGARTEAAAVEAEARHELDAYNDAMKKARAKIYAEQEAARQVVLDERARLLQAMRSRVQDEVVAAKKKIGAEMAAARTDIERQTPELAAEVARAVLEGPSAPRGGARPQ
jgi:F0F1-type ATP synthase membrane subunit b/b'